MRVAIVHPKFEPSGGAERYALGLAGGLAARGHTVDLFGRRAGALPVGCRFHRIGAFPLGRALKTYSFWRAASRRVPTAEFDVVQGFGKTTCQTVHRTGGGVHRAYLRRNGGGGSAYDRAVLRIEDQLFASPRLRAVICPSRWVAAEVEHFYPHVQPRLVVVPNGVDTARFVPAGRRIDQDRVVGELGLIAGQPVLLFVATNFALKGLARAVECLAHLPEAQLVVVGGDDPGAFRAEAERRGVAARIRFVGARSEVAGFYRAADVLIHPTDYDPFANVCLEALACGTPVVTTDRNGVADILDENCGAVLTVDVAGEQIAGEAEKLLRRGEAGRQAARRRAEIHDLSNHLAAVETVYQQVQQQGLDPFL